MSRGVLLLSGGLDSSLAGLLLRQMGVDLVALHLESPFGCDSMAETMAREIGVPLEVRPKGDAFLDILKRPKYGYGSAMNPCIDCRIHMFNIGKVFMKEVGADFLVTGEVLGQRPMSQKKKAVVTIDRDSEMEGLVLRPLSARLLQETRPEKDGTVDRRKLFGWAGRSRKPQLALAKRLGLSVIPSPAGGCLLTDGNFRERIGDFVNLDGKESTVAPLLRHGRHFRFGSGEWVIVGRNEEDNRALEGHLGEAGLAFRPAGFDGPLVCFLDVQEEQPVLEGIPVSPERMALAFGAFHAFGGGRVPEGPLQVHLLSGKDCRTIRLPVLPENRVNLMDRETWMSQWRR